MTLALERVAPVHRSDTGGAPARRAIVRWTWRLFKREWPQQLLVLCLVTVAVAATIVGAAVATNTPLPANEGFGTAQDIATFSLPSRSFPSELATLRHRFGRAEVIEQAPLVLPGSVQTFQLRAESPHGTFSQPLLSLLSGAYPRRQDEVAVTAGVASAFRLRIGDRWRVGGQTRRVVGTVANPENLLDEFALVLPGAIAEPTHATVLFDAPRVSAASIGPTVRSVTHQAPPNVVNPESISLAGVTLGMLLIALVAVGGFAVLAQRRLRSIGMLESLGATDRHLRLTLRANGVIVGVAGAVLGVLSGFAAWSAYRPSLEQSSHHVIGELQLPVAVVVVSMGLAVLTTFLASGHPARQMTRRSVVAALSGRPAPPPRVHRTVVPGVVLLVGAFLLLTVSGGMIGGGMPELVLGLAALIAAMILLGPFFLSGVAELGRRAPVAVRLALRDLDRYRARSGPALAAVALGVLIAVVICVAASARYGNVLDYTGPNLASDQMIVYASSHASGAVMVKRGGPEQRGNSAKTAKAPPLAVVRKSVLGIAAALGTRDVVELLQVPVTLQRAAPGRNFTGPLYVATPSLLRAFGIKASQFSPSADILSMRPGLAGISGMHLLPSGPGPLHGPGPGGLAHPVIETVSALPSGTSAPNTVITEHAVHELQLSPTVSGWLVQAPATLSASQVASARQAAAALGLSIETKDDAPSGGQVISYATLFGIALALAVLAMTVGLLRSETAGDLRTLAATGAGSRTRRALTATTAGALALLGALLGTIGGYAGAVAWFSASTLNGGVSALANVPLRSLLFILVAMPLFAAAVGWLVAGRQPPVIAHQPME